MTAAGPERGPVDRRPPLPAPDDVVDSTDSVNWVSVEGDSTAPDAGSSPARSRGGAPRRIGPWEVGDVVGRGAFGTVYRARDMRGPGRVVAIKVFDGRMTGVESERRFEREVEIASRLDHPNISSIIASGVDDGSPWIVMRLIEGETMRDRIERDGPLPPGEAARIVRRLAIAIQHAHSRHVIHRDLKPSNVILEGGEPVVVDLGLSKNLVGAESFTGKGDLLGSPLFMAPEQLYGEKADERSDVFALGGLLVYLLSGQTPRGLDDFRLRRTPELRLPRTVPSGLSAICARALAEAPERRFRSAAELAEVLGDWMAGRSLELGGRSLRAPGVILAGVIGLLLVALLLAFATGARRGRRLVFDRNVVNRYELGSTEVLIKDGRVGRGRDGTLTLPFLKAVVNRVEAWSPPAQQLGSQRDYLIGQDLEGLILARFDFLPGPAPVAGRVELRRLPLPGEWRTGRIELGRGPDGRHGGAVRIGGMALELRGRLRGDDETGLTWGHDAVDQLVVRLEGAPQWSPPRPSDRTDYSVEYPFAVREGLVVLARFMPRESRESISIRLRFRLPVKAVGESRN